jgi:hypothetical protein
MVNLSRPGELPLVPGWEPEYVEELAGRPAHIHTNIYLAYFTTTKTVYIKSMVS